MARIFISYSRADRQFIDQFIPLIRRVYGNDSLWFDDDIHGGVDWWQMILNEIEKCDIFVYLISNEALESSYCQAEFREALRLKKQVIPVIVRRLNPAYPGRIADDLAEILRRMQYVDMSGGFRDANTIASLYAAITRLKSAIPQQPPPPVTLTPTAQPPVPDTPQRKNNAAIYAVIASVIVLIFVLGLAVSSNSSRNTGGLTPTGAESVSAGVNTEAPLSSGGTQQTTTQSETGSTGTVAAQTVARNADWTPVERDFNGVTMVLVPAGCFDMGSSVYFHTEPVHRQCFDQPFWIDKYEVTQAQFRRLGGTQANLPHIAGDDLPVVNITWFEARDFCELRNSRLPTEAEWEYAARGPDGLVYPWGDEFIADNVVHGSNSNNRTADVGSRPSGASWVGALDMAGNVLEWTNSLYEAYPYDATDGREAYADSEAEISRTLRGGSYLIYVTGDLGTAYRTPDSPGYIATYNGFRCVRAFE